MGVGAALNGCIVWLILRGGEAQGLHLQGQAVRDQAGFMLTLAFFFFEGCLHDFLFETLVD